MSRGKRAKPLPQRPAKNWILVTASSIFALANSVAIQKWGSDVPNLLLIAVYVISLICFVIAVVREGSFLRAGGSLKVQLSENRLLFGLLVILIIGTGWYSVRAVSNLLERLKPGVHQSILENNGSITGLEMNGNSITGVPPAGREGGFILSEQDVRNLKIENTHVCYMSSWGTFLDCVLADTGNADAIRRDIQQYENGINSLLARHQNMSPESVMSCHQISIEGETKILEHIADEHETVASLRGHGPGCVKQ